MSRILELLCVTGFVGWLIWFSIQNEMWPYLFIFAFYAVGPIVVFLEHLYQKAKKRLANKKEKSDN